MPRKFNEENFDVQLTAIARNIAHLAHSNWYLMQLPLIGVRKKNPPPRRTYRGRGWGGSSSREEEKMQGFG